MGLVIAGILVSLSVDTFCDCRYGVCLCCCICLVWLVCYFGCWFWFVVYCRLLGN